MTNQNAADNADLLVQLRQDHVNIAGLLDLIEAELEAFDASDNPDYQLMLDIMHYLGHYSDLVHHPNEDLLFQRLVDRDQESRSVVESLFAEHVILGDHGRELLDLLQQIVDDAFVARDKLHESLMAYLGIFRRHIGTEEREVFPSAEHVLGTRDWVSLNGEFAKRDDPLFGDIISHEYQAIADRLSE